LFIGCAVFETSLFAIMQQQIEVASLIDYFCTPITTYESRDSRDCGSRGVTAVASREIAASQSSGGSASPVRSESGAPLEPKRL